MIASKTAAVAAVTLSLAVALAMPARPADAARPEVFLHRGRLSAVAFETPLRELMQAIAEEAGLEVRFTSDAGDERISVEIFELPLADALGRILAHRGYGRIGRDVWIGSPTLGMGETAGASLPVHGGAHDGYVAELGHRAVESRSSQSRLAATAELVRERSALAVEALRGVLGTERNPQILASALRGLEESGAVSVADLARIARDDDAGVLRRKAIDRLARHGAGDALALETLADLAAAADSPSIRAAARTALRRLERMAA